MGRWRRLSRSSTGACARTRSARRCGYTWSRAAPTVARCCRPRAASRRCLKQAERDARAAARGALLRAVLWAVGGALALGMAAGLVALAGAARSAGRWAGCWRRRCWRQRLSVAVLLRLEGSFNADAFQNPSFYANGAELAQLLNVADHAQAESKGYTSSVYRALAGYSTLLTAAGNLAETPIRQQPAVLISDLHDNELVLPALENLVSGSPIFFPGDFGQYGSRAEARSLIPRITTLGRPIIAVSGNHDSRLFMRALAKAGVIVLTDTGRLRATGAPTANRYSGSMGCGSPATPTRLNGRAPDPTNPHRIFSFARSRTATANTRRRRPR